MVCNGNLIAPICQNIDLAISRGRNCPPMGSLRFGKVLPYRGEKVNPRPTLTVNYRFATHQVSLLQVMNAPFRRIHIVRITAPG